MMENEDIWTVPLDDTVELESQEQEVNLEMPYISDTEILDVPDSCDDLLAQIIDDSLPDIVLDTDEEETKLVGSGSASEKMEEASNKWKPDTLVYRRRRSKTVGPRSASKKMEEMSNKWKPNYLVYQRRRSKNVGIGEHSSIQSLTSSRKTITEEHCESEKRGPVSYHASEIGVPALEGGTLHYPTKIVDKHNEHLECSEKMEAINLALNVADADRFQASHFETNLGEKYVSTLIHQTESEIVSKTDSEEPGEPSHMNALDFVDHFLSVNNLNIPENQKIYGGVDRMKSPPALSAKGALTLARRANLAATPREFKIYDWNEEFDARSQGQSPEKDVSEAQINDTFDVGFDTQMAAEAMEALIYAPPPPSRSDCTHEVPKTEIWSFHESALKSKESQICTNLKMPGSVTRINKKQFGNLNTSCTKLSGDTSCPLKRHSGDKKGYKSQYPFENNVVCREPLAAKALKCRKPHIVKKVIHGRNVRLVGRQKEDEISEIENSEASNDNRSSSKFTQCKQSGEDRTVQKLRNSSSTTKRNKCKPSERFSEVSKHPVNSSKRSMSNNMEIAVPKKRRTRSSSNVNIHKTVERKSFNSCSNGLLHIASSKRIQQGKCNSGLFGMGAPFKLDPWCYTRQKRTHKGVPRHSKGPCKKLHSSSSLLNELIRLGYTKSPPNFIPRGLRRRRNENISVLFSQHLESNVLNQQQKIIARLGFSVASCCSDATHFVTDRFVRTRNMMEAISLGKPVVTHCWLQSCDQANYFVDEKHFILRDAEKEREIGFSMPVTLANARKHPLLMGRRVFITPNAKPGMEVIQSLVKLVHGKVVKRIPNTEWKDGCVPSDLLILSCEEDFTACVSLLEKGAAIYDSELLLNGIVIQKLDLERHQLFTNYSCSSKRPRKR